MGSDLFNSTYIGWMEQGPESEIVISSRVRLARNLQSVPFPHLLDDNTGKLCWQQVKRLGKKLSERRARVTEFQRCGCFGSRSSWKHLISPDHAKSNHSTRGYW